MNTGKKNIVFIINPIAGRGKCAYAENIIKENINANKFNYTIVRSKKPNQVEHIAREAVSNNADIIVAGGGDGTINEIVRVIANTSVILGIIPLGSGNGLANHLKIPHKIKNAVALINRMKVKCIDTCTINNHVFISNAGLGFDAAAAKTYFKTGIRGFIGYFFSCFVNYFNYKTQRYEIIIGKDSLLRDAFIISFANSDQFGYNVSISPDAIIDDGLFNLCIVKKIPLYLVFPTLLKLLSGNINKSKYYESYFLSEVTIHRNAQSDIQIDGETIKLNDKIINVSCQKQSLKVIF